MPGRLDRLRKRLDDSNSHLMEGLADRPGWGPARDSPSSFQRWFMGASTPVSSALFGLCMGAFIGPLLLTRTLSLTVALAGAILATTAGALGFHVLRRDHDRTRDERLNATVKYLWTWRRKH